MEDWAQRFNRLVVRHAHVVLLIIALTSLLPFLSLQRIAIDTDMQSMMPEDHRELLFSNWAEKYFSIEDPSLLLVVDDGPDGVFTPETLGLVRELSHRVMALEAVDGDDLASLSEIDNITAVGDTLLVEPFFDEPPETQTEANRIRSAVFANPMMVGSVVSSDATATTIVAELLRGHDRHTVYTQIQRIVEETPKSTQRVLIAGRPMVESELGRLSTIDIERMFPIVVITAVTFLWLILGSARGALLPVAVVILSVAWVLGTTVWIDLVFQPMMTLMPTLIIAIGVADGIHVIHHYLLGVAGQPDRSTAEIVAETMDELWAPLTLTSITTAAGFLSLTASPIVSVKWLGILTALGVMYAWAFSLTLLPAALTLLPRAERAAARLARAETQPGHPIQRILSKLTTLTTKRPVLTLAVFVFLTALCLSRLGELHVDASMLANFPKGTPVKVANDEIVKRFGGTQPVNIVLTAESADAWKAPENLSAIAALQDFIESRSESGETRSLADYVKRMNQVMNGDDPTHYVIPNDRELIAQYLLLYSISGDPGDLDDVVDYDYRIANVRGNLSSDHSPLVNNELRAISRFGRSLFEPLGVELRITGNARLVLSFVNMIIDGQIFSLLIAVPLIAIIAGLVFRSVVGGLFTCLPVALATLLNFGWLPWIGSPLGVATAMISSVGIGIGVDYAIHFVMRYGRDRQRGLAPEAAMLETLSTAGVAITANAIVVMIGFSALSLSQFPPNRAFGLLVALSMAVCLLSTITLLAALLHAFKPKFLTR